MDLGWLGLKISLVILKGQYRYDQRSIYSSTLIPCPVDRDQSVPSTGIWSADHCQIPEATAVAVGSIKSLPHCSFKETTSSRLTGHGIGVLVLD